MMASSSVIWGFILIALVWSASRVTVTHEANNVPCVPCSVAVSTMGPCVQFLEGWGPDEPSPTCCLAGMQLAALCSTAETRKAVCYCFKDAKFQPPLLPSRVELLRQACVKDLPIPADPNPNCSQLP